MRIEQQHLRSTLSSETPAVTELEGACFANSERRLCFDRRNVDQSLSSESPRVQKKTTDLPAV